MRAATRVALMARSLSRPENDKRPRSMPAYKQDLRLSRIEGADDLVVIRNRSNRLLVDLLDHISSLQLRQSAVSIDSGNNDAAHVFREIQLRSQLRREITNVNWIERIARFAVLARLSRRRLRLQRLRLLGLSRLRNTPGCLEIHWLFLDFRRHFHRFAVANNFQLDFLVRPSSGNEAA